jgi:hypothetical protein
VEALRALEGKIALGMDLEAYEREVPKVYAILQRLENNAEDKGNTRRLADVVRLRETYFYAGALWRFCAQSNYACAGEYVFVNSMSQAALFVKKVLARYPELKRDLKEGGALANDGTLAYAPVLVTTLLTDAKTQGGALRESLRDTPARVAIAKVARSETVPETSAKRDVPSSQKTARVQKWARREGATSAQQPGARPPTAKEKAAAVKELVDITNASEGPAKRPAPTKTPGAANATTAQEMSPRAGSKQPAPTSPGEQPAGGPNAAAPTASAPEAAKTEPASTAPTELSAEAKNPEVAAKSDVEVKSPDQVSGPGYDVSWTRPRRLHGTPVAVPTALTTSPTHP